MTPFTAVAGIVASIAAMRCCPTVVLDPDTVMVDAAPDDVVDLLRARLRGSGDVISADGDRLVRRFAGRAGRFRYATVEVVTFGPGSIEFDHLAGPFHRCAERFTVTARRDGAMVTHVGSFALRGGLWTWPLARSSVKRAFEHHVHAHLVGVRAEFASLTEQR